MNLKVLLVLPPLALGLFGFFWMTRSVEAPSAPPSDVRQVVRAMPVTPEPLVVAATGYGRVEPVRSWSAVSQVDGRIVAVLPGLAVGSVVESGAALIDIDPTDYDLALVRSKAEIAAAEATLAELEQQETNSQRLLEIEARVLEVAQDEFLRVQQLFENGTASASALDEAERTLLGQENAVVNVSNTIALYPAQRASAEATLATRQAELAEAQRDLENTRIAAPFRGRVSSKSVETGQFVRLGEELVVLDGTDQFEVVAAFQPRAFGTVIQAGLGTQVRDLAEIDATQVVDHLREAGVMAFVVLELTDGQARYPAEMVRFRGTVESETGTIGLAVRVKDPLIARPELQRPPLEIGSFVSVVLETSPTTDAISIPRAALRQDDAGQAFVYTANEDNRLAVTPVSPGWVADDRIVILNGLSAGDQVVLSTPRPAIAGLALTLVEDTGIDP